MRDPKLSNRIIPAYAGSTTATNVSSPTSTDHPRIRGEHRPIRPDRLINRGSSPHTRGAHGQSGARRCRKRIIPAYAGSTKKPPGNLLRGGVDHPRIRGEHYACTVVTELGEGSSPHTRGAHFEVAVDPVQFGIIPAYAGSTTSSAWDGRPAPDHPRIRGEHKGDVISKTDMDRIIPAYAGSTPSRGPPLLWPSGSSPHTRGARDEISL